MEIIFRVADIVETEPISALLNPGESADDGSSDPDSDFAVRWTGPHLQSGMLGNIVEWIAQMNVSSIPNDVLANLASNYLWNLISRGRGKPADAASGDQNDQAVTCIFDDIAEANIEIIVGAKQIRFDPLEVDKTALDAALQSLFTTLE